MTESEINEGNKLIAEFMDNTYPGFARINGALIPIKNCYYHLSWDWLIPVVEKIESFDTNNCTLDENLSIGGSWTKDLFNVQIQGNGAQIKGGDNCYSEYKEFRPFGGKSKIEAVYLCVVNFIKWYNAL